MVTVKGRTVGEAMREASDSLRAFGDTLRRGGFPTGIPEMRSALDAIRSVRPSYFSGILPSTENQRDSLLEIDYSELESRMFASPLTLAEAQQAVASNARAQLSLSDLATRRVAAVDLTDLEIDELSYVDYAGPSVRDMQRIIERMRPLNRHNSGFDAAHLRSDSAEGQGETATERNARLQHFFDLLSIVARSEGWSVSQASAAMGLCLNSSEMLRFRDYLSGLHVLNAEAADYFGRRRRWRMVVAARSQSGHYWVVGCGAAVSSPFAHCVSPASSATEALATAYQMYQEHRL